jgi:hypothetical protein
LTRFQDYPVSPDCTDCNPNSGTYRGQKGVTIWGPTTFTIAAGQVSDRLYFTFTNPKCYNGLHFCNVTYTIRTDRYVYGGDDAGPIEIWINNPGSNSDFSNTSYLENRHYHSKVCYDGTEYHDVTETIDISQGGVGALLNRSGENNILFRNQDAHNVTVTIINFKIVAGYGMSGISYIGATCDDMPEGLYPAEHPDFAQRHDYPCNYYQYGYGGMGFTGFGPNGYDDHVNFLITPNQTVDWTWTNPLNPSHSYKGKVSCLFNFNNIHLNQSSTNDDVKFSLQVNNSSWVNFYHTKDSYHPMYHSVDLATHPVLSASGGYNDAPGAGNTLRLHLDSNAGASFALCDGCDNQNCPSSCIGGRVNIYRAYQTEPLNNNETITVGQSSGGQIYPGTTQVMAYQSPTFTIVADSGYHIDHVYVDNVDKGAICSFTFNSITANHTISAIFSPGCDAAESCWPCYGFCQTCVTQCEFCESGYNWCELCEFDYLWNCGLCEACFVPCDLCYNCETTCQVCYEAVYTSCEGCDTSCYSGCQGSCQMCYEGCYDCQGCNNCQENCYACEDCYGNYT